MDTKSILVGAIVTALVLSGVAAGAYAVTSMETNDIHTTETPTPTTTDTTSSEVRDSEAGAKMLYRTINDNSKYDYRVLVMENGEVVVYYESDANSGPELKQEMKQVAFAYSDVMGEHPTTGGLVVQANGVQLLVSKDAALTHSEGRLKDSAYEETFVFKSSE